LTEKLSKPFDKSQGHKVALSFNKYSLGKWELFKACFGREWLLMKRNSFVYVFKEKKLIVVGIYEIWPLVFKVGSNFPARARRKVVFPHPSGLGRREILFSQHIKKSLT